MIWPSSFFDRFPLTPILSDRMGSARFLRPSGLKVSVCGYVSLFFLIASGCSSTVAQRGSNAKASGTDAAKISSRKLRRPDVGRHDLQKKLRQANAKLVDLKTENWVLKKKLELLRQSARNSTSTNSSAVVKTLKPDDSLDLTRAMKQPRTADEILAQAVLGHANMGNLDEAERTLQLLIRSYPDADLTRDTRESYMVHLIEAGFNERAAQIANAPEYGAHFNSKAQSTADGSGADLSKVKR